MVLKNFFLFILIFLAMSVLFINLTAFVNSIFIFLCHFQHNPSNCCCKSLEDPLFSYCGLLKSQRYMQTWYASILGKIVLSSLPWRGLKELLMCWYRKGLQGEAGSGVPCCHRDGMERGCRSTGEAVRQELPAGRDGLTMSFAWLLPDAASFVSSLLLVPLSRSITWRKKYTQTDLRQGPRPAVWGIILYSSAVASFLLAWTFFFQHLAPVIFRETCCFLNVICPDQGKLSPLWVFASRQSHQSGEELCALLVCLALACPCLPTLQKPRSLERIPVRSAIPHPITPTSRGKTTSTGSPGFLAICVLLAWGQRVLKLLQVWLSPGIAYFIIPWATSFSVNLIKVALQIQLFWLFS